MTLFADRYELLEKVGSGGMGTVWKARDVRLDRIVALKGIASTQEDDRQRFEREARTAAKLRHPNIVPVHDVGVVGDQCYLTMDFIDGKGLLDAGLDRRQVLEAILQTADALQHAHEHGIIHRDVKPDNILVDARGLAHLTDFGLARPVRGSKLTVSGTVLGTPAYMSPEQSRGPDVDARSDVYSLGASLYELLAGRPPFEGESLYEVMGRIQSELPAAIPGVARDLQTIVLKCLEKKPEHRYRTAKQFAEDLRRFLRGEPIQARSSMIRRLLWRVTHARATIWIAAAVALLVAGGVIVSQALAARRTRREIAQLRPQARDARAQKRFADAARLFDRIASLDPADAEAREFAEWHRGYQERERRIATLVDTVATLPFDARPKVWDEILAIDPDRADAWRERGICLFRLGRHGEAKRDLLRSIELRPADPAAHFWLGVLHRDHDKDPEAARREFEEARRHDPKGWAGLWNLAFLHLERKEYAAYAKVLTEILLLQPDLAVAYHDRAVAYVLLDRPKDAFDDADHAIRMIPGYASAYGIRAWAHWKQHRLEEAFQDAERAIALDPALSGAYETRALVHNERRRFDLALADLEKAHSLDPRHPGFKARMARILLSLGRFEESKAEIDAALRIDPEDPETWNILSNWYLDRGLLADAERAAGKALALRPDALDATYVMGQVVAAKEGAERAIAYYTEALARKPENFRARMARANLRYGRREFDLALEDYREVARNPDDDGAAHFGIGQVHRERQDHAPAADAFAESARRGYVRAYYNLGLCLERLHKHAEARAAYQKTVELDPDPARREKARKALERMP